jgi:hypothetical protein
MNHSTIHQEIPRQLAVRILSEERGRSDRPLDPSLISKWCADLGFGLRLRYFSTAQFELLRIVNQHYASGGSRRELLQKLRTIQHGNDLNN